MSSKKTVTIRHLLKVTQTWFAEKGISSARLDAEVLLAKALGIERLGLYLDMDRPLSEQETATYREMVRRRGKKEPVAYIVGQKEFYGIDIDVACGVLIPRPDTEHLVELALSLLPKETEATAVDVCTGSGCVAIALAKNRPLLSLWATEIDDQAYKIAIGNIEKYALEDRIQCLQGSYLTPCPKALKVDLLVGNPPYVFEEALADLEPDVKDFEPSLALLGLGEDALGCHRDILKQGVDFVRPEGHALLEIGYDQGDSVQMLKVEGWTFIELHYDLSGHPRVAQWRRDD